MREEHLRDQVINILRWFQRVTDLRIDTYQRQDIEISKKQNPTFSKPYDENENENENEKVHQT